MRGVVCLASVVAGLAGCSGEQRSEPDGLGSGIASSGADDAEDGDEGPRFDIGDDASLDLGPADPESTPAEGCDKVDFLFVIDNSGSMADDQTNLVNSFPGFIDAIQSTLVEVDKYQVGIVTTDRYFPNVAGGHDCASNLSGLVTQTGGENSSNAVCGPYAEGNNFMTEVDDLPLSFACAAQVGSGGDGAEFPMAVLEETVNRVFAGPGQCNEGFIRKDALLVIVVITDEADGPTDPDIHSPGTPSSWYDTVVAAKGGFPENAAIVSLIQWPLGPCPVIPGSDADGSDIRDFTELFGDNGFLGGVCEPDYSPLLTDAVGVIEHACKNFIPPG